MKIEADDFDESIVTLDTYNSDLNLSIDASRYSAHPLTNEGFAFMWAGARATHGASRGMFCFEVKILDHIDVSHLPADEPSPHVVRVGFSIESSSLQLGEDPLSYGYGGTGKISTNCQFKDFGQSFMAGDVILGAVNMDAEMVQIGFAKNGAFLGWAYRVTKHELKGQALFPHVLTKNVAFEVNFGQKETPYFPLPDILKDYVFIGCLPLGQKQIGTRPPKERQDCEMIMMCGLPGAGKSVWAANYSKKYPKKKFNVLGTNNIIDKMKVMGLPRKRNYAGRWDVLIQMATKCLNKMFEIGSKLRRNYILDQTNVYPTAQRRKMRNFEGFQRKAVVIVPSEAEYKRRCDKRDREEGKEVPDHAVLEMKANFKLPEENDIFNEVIYAELPREEAEKLVAEYNEEGKAAVGPPKKQFKPNDQSSGYGNDRGFDSGRGNRGSPGRSGYSSRGGFESGRGGYESGRIGYEGGRGGFRGGRGGFNGNRGGFDGNRGSFGNRGGFNRNRGGFEGSRGGSEGSRGGSEGSRGGFEGRRGGFEESRGGIEVNRGSYGNRSSFESNRSDFDSNRSSSESNRGVFDRNRGDFDGNRDGYNGSRGGYDGGRGSYDNRGGKRGGFDGHRGGFNSNRGGFDGNSGSFDSNRSGCDGDRDGYSNKRSGHDGGRVGYDCKRGYDSPQRFDRSEGAGSTPGGYIAGSQSNYTPYSEGSPSGFGNNSRGFGSRGGPRGRGDFGGGRPSGNQDSYSSNDFNYENDNSGQFSGSYGKEPALSVYDKNDTTSVGSQLGFQGGASRDASRESNNSTSRGYSGGHNMGNRGEFGTGDFNRDNSSNFSSGYGDYKGGYGEKSTGEYRRESDTYIRRETSSYGSGSQAFIKKEPGTESTGLNSGVRSTRPSGRISRWSAEIPQSPAYPDSSSTPQETVSHSSYRIQVKIEPTDVDTSRYNNYTGSSSSYTSYIPPSQPTKSYQGTQSFGYQTSIPTNPAPQSWIGPPPNTVSSSVVSGSQDEQWSQCNPKQSPPNQYFNQYYGQQGSGTAPNYRSSYGPK